MVSSVSLATSKRLCFMASIARSNKTLSGCLEPTFASGLVTFLFVQPTARASMHSRITTGIRRDITPQKYLSALNFQQCGFSSCLQQFLSVSLWIALTEHRVACHQDFCPCPYHLGHGFERNSPIHFNTIV